LRFAAFVFYTQNLQQEGKKYENKDDSCPDSGDLHGGGVAVVGYC
jgi:hypothetical protein